MPSFYYNFLGFFSLSLHAFYDLPCLEWLKINIFMINYRKMLLLKNQFSWVPCNVPCMPNLLCDLCLLCKPCILILILTLGLLCISVVVYRVCCVHVPLHSASSKFHSQHVISCHRIILMHASHSYIIVTESSEVEPVEPTESVEPEPGVQFGVELEVNQGKKLNIFLAPI